MRIIIGSSLCVIAMDEASTTTREQERNSKRRRMRKVVSWGWRCCGISLSRVGIDCSMEMGNREIYVPFRFMMEKVTVMMLMVMVMVIPANDYDDDP